MSCSEETLAGRWWSCLGTSALEQLGQNGGVQRRAIEMLRGSSDVALLVNDEGAGDICPQMFAECSHAWWKRLECGIRDSSRSIFLTVRWARLCKGKGWEPRCFKTGLDSMKNA